MTHLGRSLWRLTSRSRFSGSPKNLNMSVVSEMNCESWIPSPSRFSMISGRLSGLILPNALKNVNKNTEGVPVCGCPARPGFPWSLASCPGRSYPRTKQRRTKIRVTEEQGSQVLDVQALQLSPEGLILSNVLKNKKKLYWWIKMANPQKIISDSK